MEIFDRDKIDHMKIFDENRVFNKALFFYVYS